MSAPMLISRHMISFLSNLPTSPLLTFARKSEVTNYVQLQLGADHLILWLAILILTWSEKDPLWHSQIISPISSSRAGNYQYSEPGMFIFDFHGQVFPPFWNKVAQLYNIYIFIAPYFFQVDDEVAEWLRRWTANPLGSARVGSNPILVDNFLLILLLQCYLL